MVVKELLLVETPIQGYMMYGYHLAVTFSHIQAWPWFFNNYIQLQCNSSHLTLTELVDFTNVPKGEVHLTEGTSKYNPWLHDSIQLDQAALDSCAGSISRYIVDRIKEDNYVETFVDEYYIPALFNGDRIHFRHRLLIYGYNELSRRFNIIGFDRNKLYRKLECTYDEFERAFAEITPQMFERTKLFKPMASESRVAVFDPEKFVNVANDYLASQNTLLDPDLRGDLKDEDKLWFGMKTYQFLEEYVNGVMEKNISRPDIRGFYIFWEHKKCMLERMKWLQEMGYRVTDSLITQYQQVVSLSELARARVVMYARGYSESKVNHLVGIPRYLNEAKAIEADVLEQLIDAVAS